MRSDHAYVIGSTHEVCQDYATSREQGEDCAYGIVADGCSGSKKSEIGAMLLSELTARMLREQQIIDISFFGSLISKAELITEALGQDTICLDTTLLGVVINKQKISTFVAGDGYRVERRQKVIKIDEFTSPSGYPQYLSYKLANRIQDSSYIDTSILHKKYKYTEALDPIPLLYPPAQHIRHGDPYLHQDFRNHQVSVSVVSDGAGHVIDKDHNLIPPEIILNELTAFKSIGGRFVQRRLNGFRKKIAKEGWQCQDDISIASIIL